MIEKERIEELVAQELEDANKKYPLFHSPHEGWAVLKEEVEELEEEFSRINGHMNYAWVCVKIDRNFETNRKAIYNTAISMIQEAIQVCAMAEKIRQSNLYEE